MKDKAMPKEIQKLQFYFTSPLMFESNKFDIFDQTFMERNLEAELCSKYKNTFEIKYADIQEIAVEVKKGMNSSKPENLAFVAGIVVPIGHNNKFALANIAHRIYPVIDRYSSANYLFDKWKIPVFQAHEFIPGYQYPELKPVGNFYPEDFHPLIEPAYNIWVDKNKSRWHQEIERRLSK